MRRSLPVLTMVTVALAGLCGPASSGLARSHPAQTVAAANDLLYVSGGVSSSVVSIYDQRSLQRVGTITQGLDGAFGLFVDRHRQLYVTNLINGTVAVYAPGGTTPFEMLTGAGAPLSVAVARNGTVFVANEGSLNSGSYGNVLEYLKGQTTPFKIVVAFGKDTFPSGVALDSAENLYVAFNHKRSPSFRKEGEVLEISPNSPNGRDLGIRIGHTGAITIDESNDIVLVDQGKATYFPPAIDVFAPGSTKPSKRFLVNGCPGVGVALNRPNTKLWSVCPWLGKVYGLRYPGGQLRDALAPGGWVFGVATSPAGATR